MYSHCLHLKDLHSVYITEIHLYTAATIIKDENCKNIEQNKWDILKNTINSDAINTSCFLQQKRKNGYMVTPGWQAKKENKLKLLSSNSNFCDSQKTAYITIFLIRKWNLAHRETSETLWAAWHQRRNQRVNEEAAKLYFISRSIYANIRPPKIHVKDTNFMTLTSLETNTNVKHSFKKY